MMYLLPSLLLWSLFFNVCSCYHSLLFATSHDIRTANPAKPKKVSIIVSELQEVHGLDYCYDESMVCWTDTIAEEINCVTYNGSQSHNKTTYAKNDVSKAEGLACDWLTKKLYWTDSDTKKIEVMSLRSKHRKVLFWQDLDQPRGIAVDPLSGLLFWTDWGEIPKIERASMNGNLSTRKTIISENIFWPNSITLDVNKKKMYWIDAKLLKIEVTDYNGRNRTILLNRDLNYPFALTHYLDVLFWTDWKDNSAHAYNYTSGNSPIELIHYSHESLMDIEVIEQSHQPMKSTPCDTNNGGCSHLCLLSSDPPGYSCACPTGIKFINGTTCANEVDRFLLLEQQVEISKISLDTPDYTSFKIPLKNVKHAMTIDYDPAEEFFYFADEDFKNIRRAKLDGSMQENVIIHDVSNVEGIAIDWIARNIYWSNAGTNRIEVSRLNTNYRKAIIVDDIESPRAIAVSPEQGWLFWSDWSEKYPKIERTDLDGTNRLVIVKDHIKWPNGIALDIENEKLYWCDAGIDVIEVINMDGKERREIVNDLPHPFGITVLGDHVYLTDWQLRTLERVNKHSGQDRQTLLEQLHDVMGIKAIDKNVKLGTNLCAKNNAMCEQFCFYKPIGNTLCSCQIEYELGIDGRSCMIPDAYLIIYSDDNLRRVSIQNNFVNDILPVTGIESISAIDVDINNSRLYYADNKVKSISRAFLNGSQVEKIVEFGIHSPESLAIDWLSSNLYWADAGSKRIEVTTLSGNYRKTLYWKNLKEPRNLVLDPRTGYMFWSEWDGQIGGIFKATMDGTSKMLFISDVGRINGLTIDYTQRSLYWTQYKNNVASIEFCDSKGKNRRQILSSKLYKPMSINQYQDHLFLANYKNGSIIRVNKFTGSDTKVLYSQSSEISDLRIVHSSKQNGWNACTRNNGNCKQLCLVKPGASDPSTDRTCACATHHVMKNGICHPPDNFVLFSLKNALFRLLPSADECPDMALPVPGMKTVRAIEYDPTTKYVYWIEGKTSAIKRSYENGSHSVTIVSGTQNGRSLHFYDIALEPYNKLLYWTCSVSNSINVTRLNNSSLGYIYKATHGEKPRNIAVHSDKGYVFWTDVGVLPRIVRSQLDGQGRMYIETNGRSVEAITIDRKDDLLFYTHNGEILYCDLNGKHKTIVGSLHLEKIASLTVIDHYLYYWIEYKGMHPCIEKMDKLTGTNRSTVVDNVQVTDLITVTSINENELFSNPCSSARNHGGCAYFCLRSSINPDMANCSCPIGLKLNDDERSCASVPPCGKEHFMCDQSTGECTPAQWRCDGTADCPDGSDEKNCPICAEFKCHSGECVRLNAVCDGKIDCADRSDEIGCCSEEFLNLRVPYFRCINDDTCILRSSVCDGIDNCPDRSDELQCVNNHVRNTYSDDSSNFVVMVALMLLITFIVLLIYFAFRCKRHFKRSPMAEQDNAALRPLAPNGRQIGTLTTIGTKSASVTHSVMNGSSGSYDRSHITGASSSTSMNHYPLNPPPSPATTILRQECCCNKFSVHHPTPCSTDVCDESDAKTDSDGYVVYKNSENGSIKYCRGYDRYPRYKHDRLPKYRERRYVADYDEATPSLFNVDYDFCPPPTPRSNSSGGGLSPSSSTYFRPLPELLVPPPSPTN